MEHLGRQEKLTLWGARPEIAVRIATIRAVGREPGNYYVRVTAEDFEWAAELVRIAGDILAKEAPSEMEAELTRIRMAKRILNVLKKHGGETSQRDLFRAIPLNQTLVHAPSCSSRALASLRTGVSKPSVNQPYMGSSRPRASSRLPCRAKSRARLVAAGSSHDFASCPRAIETALRNEACARLPWDSCEARRSSPCSRLSSASQTRASVSSTSASAARTAESPSPCPTGAIPPAGVDHVHPQQPGQPSPPGMG
jgi:hypothetical protein